MITSPAASQELNPPRGWEELSPASSLLSKTEEDPLLSCPSLQGLQY